MGMVAFRSPKPRLLERVRAALRTRTYSTAAAPLYGARQTACSAHDQPRGPKISG